MLELKNIRKAFDGKVILNDISLNIEDGEIVSILGPSGSGKTTLLNLILGITDIDKGKLVYNGQDLTHVPIEQRGFNIVFQDYALFPNLNAYQNITYGLKNKPGISTQEEVEDLIDLLGLREHLDKKIEQLSGGQKQRVALARTMVMKPKILLLDEPSMGLAPILVKEIFRIIQEINKQGTTILLVEQNARMALAVCDRAYVMETGNIVLSGSGEELSRSEQIQKAYLGG